MSEDVNKTWTPGAVEASATLSAAKRVLNHQRPGVHDGEAVR